jgi:hypothetical protein
MARLSSGRDTHEPLGRSGRASLGRSGAFSPVTDPAQAAAYCLNKCEDAAYDHARDEMDAKRVKLLAAVVAGGASFAYEYVAVITIMAGIETRLLSALSDCQGPNCGNASKYPNPIRTGPGGGGPPEPPPPPVCPPMTGVCPNSNPPQCCLGSDVCCGCGYCCTYAQYCDGCCPT